MTQTPEQIAAENAALRKAMHDIYWDATNMVKLQARVAELEAERAEWVEVERLRMGKV